MSRICDHNILERLQRLYRAEHGAVPADLHVQEHIPAQVRFDVRVDGEWFEVRVPEDVLQSSPLDYVEATYLRKAMRRLPPPA